MKKWTNLVMALFLLVAAVPALAGLNDVTRVLEHQRQHGYGSPSLAAGQLTALEADLTTAPLILRMRYHATLAALYVVGEQPEYLKRELDELGRMAAAEKCVPCGYYKLVRESQMANRKQDIDAASKLLVLLEPLTSDDLDLMQAIHYMRGLTLNSTGSDTRAIEELIKASQLSIKTDNPAEQVRSLNLLMLSNIARRDLAQAELLADEAYKLAERIGFTYMMAYVRANQAWIHSLKGEPEQQLLALIDALKIARRVGLGDAELVNLVNLAEYYVEQNAYQKAADTAKQAVVLAEKQNKQVYKGVVMGSLGRAQVGLGETDKGIATVKEAVDMLTKAGAKSNAQDATSTLALVYERSGKLKEALETLQKFIVLKDEAAHLQNEKLVTEAQLKFSAERKDHEIERLSLENNVRKVELAASAWEQRLWVTAALALALSGVLLVQMVTRSRRRNRTLENNNAVLSDQSVRDPLTAAFNRRHCLDIMGQQEAVLASKSRDRNNSSCVGLILLDVDHFKHINDTFGHSAGDAVLVEIAQRLQALVRQHDVVIRWGGEEFVLILPGTAPEGMAVLVDRALKEIAGAPVLAEGHAISVTMSAGCACYPLLPGQPWQDSLKVADFAMYMAKQAGRNRAICLIGLAEGAPKELLLSDLVAANAAGHVTLRTIVGPPSEGDGIVTDLGIEEYPHTKIETA